MNLYFAVLIIRNNMKKKSYKILDDIYWVGVIDYDLKVFDIIVKTDFGSTYNSYLIKGSEKVALIATAKATFKKEFIERLTEIVAIKDIDYLILNHTEPDHSGLVRYILEENPNIEIYATGPALMNLKEITNLPIKGNRVSQNMVLSLGNKTLEFYIQPNLHWPDTMFTYLKEDKILFTCDFFGAHYASHDILAKNLKDKPKYLIALQEYFDAIMSPFKPAVREGLNTVKQINPDYIAVSHGVVLNRPLIDEAINLYTTNSLKPKPLGNPLVLIPYASAYGYTKKMADIIKETIEKELDNKVLVKQYDLIYADINEIVKDLAACSLFIIGSSTILRDTVDIVWELLAKINYTMTKGKIASAFGSFGWSGEAVEYILQREKQLRFNTVPGLKIKFNPSKEQTNQIVEYAKDLATQIKKG